ncbi:Imm42 family immunity protein [Nocardia brasiliensis]|uniref:Imm42 family immunity protein n=1 Tax=Nocardia brasiliensis TaxID=37326 RepID=UPI00142E8E95|nr:Imm42 family immunity protein [Nocardia brasiliensis]
MPSQQSLPYRCGRSSSASSSPSERRQESARKRRKGPKKIIGDTNRFAVEYELDAQLLADPELREWLYGRIRWWCGGEQVGIFEPNTTIRDVAINVKHFLSYAGLRHDDHLMKESTETVHRTVIAAIYEDHGQSDDQIAADSDHYSRFLINPTVDVFDPWDILLVEDDHRGRLIWSSRKRRDETGRIVDPTGLREVDLTAGEFDDVQRRFLAGLPRQ